MLKRKQSTSAKKNVRWRAVHTNPPPPSPDMSVGAMLVGHSTSFMLRQFISPNPVDSRATSPAIEISAEAAVALTRSLPNIQAVEPEWPEPSPPSSRWKKRTESVDIPVVVLGNDVRDADHRVQDVQEEVDGKKQDHQPQVVPQQQVVLQEDQK